MVIEKSKNLSGAGLIVLKRNYVMRGIRKNIKKYNSDAINTMLAGVSQFSYLPLQNDPSRENVLLIDAVFGEFPTGSSFAKFSNVGEFRIFLKIPFF